jgi:hypothetical protein
MDRYKCADGFVYRDRTGSCLLLSVQMSGEDIKDYAEFTSGKTLIGGGFEYTLGIVRNSA